MVREFIRIIKDIRITKYEFICGLITAFVLPFWFVFSIIADILFILGKLFDELSEGIVHVGIEIKEKLTK